MTKGNRIYKKHGIKWYFHLESINNEIGNGDTRDWKDGNHATLYAKLSIFGFIPLPVGILNNLGYN